MRDYQRPRSASLHFPLAEFQARSRPSRRAFPQTEQGARRQGDHGDERKPTPCRARSARRGLRPGVPGWRRPILGQLAAKEGGQRAIHIHGFHRVVLASGHGKCLSNRGPGQIGNAQTSRESDLRAVRAALRRRVARRVFSFKPLAEPLSGPAQTHMNGADADSHHLRNFLHGIIQGISEAQEFAIGKC